MSLDNYQGPGLYEHYKGGTYRVHGVGRHESRGVKLVVYNSLDAGHELDRASEGINFILRPLNDFDGPDPFNGMVHPRKLEGEHPDARLVTDEAHLVPRFRKVSS